MLVPVSPYFAQATQESFPELTVLQKKVSQKQTIRFDISQQVSRMSAPEKNYFTIWAPASQVKTVDCIYKQEILKNLQAADSLSHPRPSSETQGQLVGTTGFSWAKVCNKSGRAPGRLLLPNEFQKRLKSRLLIGQKNIFLANQNRNSRATLMSSYTRLFSSSNAVVAWPVQREHF